MPLETFEVINRFRNTNPSLADLSQALKIVTEELELGTADCLERWRVRDTPGYLRSLARYIEKWVKDHPEQVEP